MPCLFCGEPSTVTTIVLIADAETGDAVGVIMDTCDAHNPASLMEPAGDPRRVAHLI